MHFGPKPNPFSVQNFSWIEIYFSISILDHFEYLQETIFHTKNPTKNKIPTKVLHMVDCGSSSFIPIKSIGFSDPNQQKIDFYLKQNDSKNLDGTGPWSQSQLPMVFYIMIVIAICLFLCLRGVHYIFTSGGEGRGSQSNNKNFNKSPLKSIKEKRMENNSIILLSVNLFIMIEKWIGDWTGNGGEAFRHLQPSFRHLNLHRSSIAPLFSVSVLVTPKMVILSAEWSVDEVHTKVGINCKSEAKYALATIDLQNSATTFHTTQQANYYLNVYVFKGLQ